MEQRNSVFHRLKPPCVALSEAALALSGRQGNTRTVTDRLEALHATLSSVTNGSDALDSKLADYAFFPISNTLKFSQKLPVRSLEMSLQCVECLLSKGWKEQIQPQLAAQLVILCTLLAENDPKGLAFSIPTNDLRASAFSCLFLIFSVLGLSVQCRATLTSEANFPQLGHTISVLLSGIETGSSFEVQSAATRALQAFVVNVQDRELNASFLPGIVSKLSRVLAPDTRQRRNHKVLVGCLDTLGQLLRTTLGDHVVTSEPEAVSKTVNGDNESKSLIDADWTKTAVGQLRLALNNIFRLRKHSREDVQHALGSLCLVLLRDCWSSLSDLSSMALKCLLEIFALHSETGLREQLEHLVHAPINKHTPSFPALLQSILYDLIQSLPTLMQGSDEMAKVARLQQIGVARNLLASGDVDITPIDRFLAEGLRNSVTLTIAVSGKHARSSSNTSAIQSLDLAKFSGEQGMTSFSSPLVNAKGQEGVLLEITSLNKLAGSYDPSVFVNEFSRAFETSEGDSRISSFWLLLSTLQDALRGGTTMESMLSFGDDSSSECQAQLEYLYDHALTILNASHDEETDYRMTALALRTLALRAEMAGKDFRYELVDTLYPVLHALATPNEQLQCDSIVTLNIIASACEYASVEDLLVQNSDYLTNAVALKLNDFDVSPQAPQVLLMMLKLAGPKLLPYMEDTVQSIFSALEDYHGYPLLVELLFRVLGVMAEEGVKTPQLAITDGLIKEAGFIQQEKWEPVSLAGLALVLRERAEDERKIAVNNPEESARLESHPRKPWKETVDETESEAGDATQAEEDDDSQSENQVQDVEIPPPAPKTYSLLLKITELTQHFLPAASPALRTSLLGLIKTTTPAIAKHENSFLPLINTLWPEIVSRLDDAEPYIVASTLEIVAILCETAGDFMRTRITQLWPRLLELYSSSSADILRLGSTTKSTTQRSQDEERALTLRTASLLRIVERIEVHPADYADTMTRQLWSALTEVLTATVAHVSIAPEMFDEALQMLIPSLRQPRIREVLERENADAVWLAELKIGARKRPQRPELPTPMAWNFAAVQC